MNLLFSNHQKGYHIYLKITVQWHKLSDLGGNLEIIWPNSLHAGREECWPQEPHVYQIHVDMYAPLPFIIFPNIRVLFGISFQYFLH